MKNIKMYSHLANQPIRLSEEEKQNPHKVLEDFFSCFQLQDLREMQWDWLAAALSTESGQYSTGFARSNLVFVYEKLELMIEAAHLIHKRHTKRQRRKERKMNEEA